MADSNPYQSPNSGPESLSSEPLPPQSNQTFMAAAKHGLWLGAKWTTYVIGPLAVLAFIFAIVVTVGRFAFTRGNSLFSNPELRWETIEMLVGPFGFYLVSCFWGSVFGMIISLLLFFFRRPTPNDRLA